MGKQKTQIPDGGDYVRASLTRDFEGMRMFLPDLFRRREASERPANLAEDPFYVLQNKIVNAMDLTNPPARGLIKGNLRLRLYYEQRGQK